MNFAGTIPQERSMATLDAVLSQIQELDGALSEAEDILDTEPLIFQRAALLDQAGAELAQLGRDGQQPTRSQVDVLRQTSRVSLEMLRKAVFAKHQVATEMTQLRQEQRLSEFVTPAATPPRRLNLEA